MNGATFILVKGVLYLYQFNKLPSNCFEALSYPKKQIIK